MREEFYAVNGFHVLDVLRCKFSFTKKQAIKTINKIAKKKFFEEYLFLYLPKKFRRDKDVILVAADKNSLIYRHIPTEVIDKEIALDVAEKNEYKILPLKLQTDKDVLNSFLEYNPNGFHDLPTEIFEEDNKELLQQCLNLVKDYLLNRVNTTVVSLDDKFYAGNVITMVKSKITKEKAYIAEQKTYRERRKDYETQIPKESGKIEKILKDKEAIKENRNNYKKEIDEYFTEIKEIVK